MISKDKNYRTLGGYEFKIYEIYEDKIHGAYTMGDTWLIDSVTQNDLIEISPYEGFKIDDKVLVWDANDTDKSKGHFAGVDNNGKPQTFYEGATSFTNDDDDRVTWDNCIKYEEQND
jgi:hypothetical protein